MEPNYYELGVYIFFLGLVVQSLFRIFDPIIDILRDNVYRLLGLKIPDYEEIEVIRSEGDVSDNSTEDQFFHGEDHSNVMPDEGEAVGSSSNVITDDGETVGYGRRYDRYNRYDPMFPPSYIPRADRLKRRKMKVTWKELVGPPIIGLLVAWLFLPLTVFEYLGFQPRYPIVAYIITSLVISRIANAEYDTFKTVGQFFVGIAKRF